MDAFLKACVSHDDVLNNLSLIKFLQLTDAKPVLRISSTETKFHKILADPIYNFLIVVTEARHLLEYIQGNIS